ncbi:MAG: nucleotidyltransferase domain-containing protein [Gemmatimonadota bacterium]
MIIPNMGTTLRRPGLADALFTRVQQRVLGLLFGQPDRRFQSAEIIRLAGSGTGATHRLLTTLADAGLITVAQSGNQKHYQANRNSPVYRELNSLVLKTVAVTQPLRRALRSHEKAIAAAFVFGSVAADKSSAYSDIDLMVVSDTLTYPDLFRALTKVERELARPVSANVLTRREWRAKLAKPGSFASRVARGPRLFIIGSDSDLD